MSINMIHDIADMTAAITEQCDLLASVNIIHHTSGLGISINVQVRLTENANFAEDWWHASADTRNDRSMTQLRDDLAAFIVRHRPGYRPITTDPGAAIGSDDDMLPAKRTIEQLEASNQWQRHIEKVDATVRP